MAAFGAISASISTGGRVATERHIGWNRQLRLTPLPGWGYLAVKAAVAMLVALPALLLVFGVGRWSRASTSALLHLARRVLAAWLVGAAVRRDRAADRHARHPGSAQGMATVDDAAVLPCWAASSSRPQCCPPALASVAQCLPSYWIVAETLGQVSGAGARRRGCASCVLAAGWWPPAGW